MKRRTVISTAIAVSLAGCPDDTGNGNGDNTEDETESDTTPTPTPTVEEVELNIPSVYEVSSKMTFKLARLRENDKGETEVTRVDNYEATVNGAVDSETNEVYYETKYALNPKTYGRSAQTQTSRFYYVDGDVFTTELNDEWSPGRTSYRFSKLLPPAVQIYGDVPQLELQSNTTSTATGEITLEDYIYYNDIIRTALFGMNETNFEVTYMFTEDSNTLTESVLTVDETQSTYIKISEFKETASYSEVDDYTFPDINEKVLAYIQITERQAGTVNIMLSAANADYVWAESSDPNANSDETDDNATFIHTEETELGTSSNGPENPEQYLFENLDNGGDIRKDVMYTYDSDEYPNADQSGTLTVIGELDGETRVLDEYEF